MNILASIVFIINLGALFGYVVKCNIDRRKQNKRFKDNVSRLKHLSYFELRRDSEFVIRAMRFTGRNNQNGVNSDQFRFYKNRLELINKELEIRDKELGEITHSLID